jgi:ABC-type dipeptide/oligopeptide/nickel transport system permease component
MASYIVRRLVAMVLMLIALSMIVFLLFNALPATRRG